MDDVLEPEQLEREFKRVMNNMRVLVSAPHAVPTLVPKRFVGKTARVNYFNFPYAWGRVAGEREGDVFRVGELEWKPRWTERPNEEEQVADVGDGPHIASVYPTWQEPLPEEPTFEDFQLSSPNISRLTPNGPDAQLPIGEVPFVLLGILRRKMQGGAELAIWSKAKKRLFYVRLVGQLDASPGELVFLEANLDRQNGILVIAHVHQVSVVTKKKKKKRAPKPDAD